MGQSTPAIAPRSRELARMSAELRERVAAFAY